MAVVAVENQIDDGPVVVLGFWKALLVALIGAAVGFALIGFWNGRSAITQIGLHALLRHGAAASEVSAMFGSNGHCDRGPSAELYNPESGRWTYICFETDADGKSTGHIWVLSDRINTVNTEITAFSVTNPENYIYNLFLRGNGLITYTDGIPRWFLVLWEAARKIVWEGH